MDAVTRNDAQKANEVFSLDKAAGLKLFIGKANCVKCHNTPLLSDDDFHNTGMPQQEESERDLGRAEGVVQNFQDEFKCWSEYSDDRERDCPALRYMQAREGSFIGAFKTPSLRKAEFVAPFMHNGSFTNLHDVLDHYNRRRSNGWRNRTKPFTIEQKSLKQLEAFLQTLRAPANAPPSLLRDPFAKNRAAP